MTALSALLPSEANNDYRGGRLPLYAFGLLLVPLTFRSFVHLLKDDSGVNSIASIVTFAGTPDPNHVIYMYSSLWGSQQLIVLLVYAVVLLRYRNLVPLLWALFGVEVLLRFGVVGVLHPLTPEYYAHTPPGKAGNLPLLVLSGGMLFLSLRNTMKSEDGAAPAPATV